MMACCPTTGDAELQENWHSPDTAQVDQEDEGKGVTEEDLNGELPSLAATVIDESKLQNDDVDCELQTTLDESTMEVDTEKFEPQGLVPGIMMLSPDEIWWELKKFLEEKWFAIEYWEKVIKSRMQQAYSEATPVVWSPGKMEQWPCDARLVHEVCDELFDIRLHLGSIAAFLKVNEIQDDLRLVISMNDEDDKRKGEPSDWHEFFAHRQIFNIRYRGWDEMGIQWFDLWGKWVEKIWEFVMIWNQMIYDFIEHHNRFREKNPDSGTFSVLVHCYGGVNRSGAATLCIAMILQKITLVEALEKTILKHVPGQQYWQRRTYFIPALLFFQHLNIQPLAEAGA